MSFSLIVVIAGTVHQRLVLVKTVGQKINKQNVKNASIYYIMLRGIVVLYATYDDDMGCAKNGRQEMQDRKM